MTKQTLRLAFFLTLLVVIAQGVGAVLANSLALLSDAGHALIDIFALGLAWFAASQSERPADAKKTFGYHRLGILAALANAITLIFLACFILVEAVQRFQHPEPVQPLYMLASAGIGVAANLLIGFALQKEGGDLNVKAATLHAFGDAGASIGVIAAGLLILFTKLAVADPLLSVGIAGLIALWALRIIRETIDILLESVPKGIDMEALVQDMRCVKGVQEVHNLHVWCIASDVYALSCHALIPDLLTSDSTAILRTLEKMLSEKYHIGHTTVQFEYYISPDNCSVHGLYCQIRDCGE